MQILCTHFSSLTRDTCTNHLIPLDSVTLMILMNEIYEISRYIIMSESTEWIKLARNRFKWRASVETGNAIPVSIKDGGFLTS